MDNLYLTPSAPVEDDATDANADENENNNIELSTIEEEEDVTKNEQTATETDIEIDLTHTTNDDDDATPATAAPPPPASVSSKTPSIDEKEAQDDESTVIATDWTQHESTDGLLVPANEKFVVDLISGGIIPGGMEIDMLEIFSE
mgnify:CR=1 FL=1